MRRVHVDQLVAGELALPAGEAHHLRDVLRLGVGDEVELFDDLGRRARGQIVRCEAAAVIIRAGEWVESARDAFEWIIAAAVPKGPRADWMIEKLCELGAAAFVPLRTARSVVAPEGKGKRERWSRLAAEAAKQSRRRGVMRIDALIELSEFLAQCGAPAWFLSTAPGAMPILRAAERLPIAKRCLTLLIGPEGGWTDEEIAAFADAGLTGVSLGTTILRIETAALAAAAVVAAIVAAGAPNAGAGGQPVLPGSNA